MYYLVANNGPQAGHKYELKGDKWILGRHPDCHIVVEVGAVSRNHCQVIRDGNDYKLEDLGSRNGTFLNDETEKISRPADAEAGRCDAGLRSQLYVWQRHGRRPLGYSGRCRPRPSAQLLDGRGAGRVSSPTTTADRPARRSCRSSKSRRPAAAISVSASPEVKLAAMVEIMQNLGKALSLDEVLPQVLKSLFKIFVQADRGFIVMQTPDGKLIPRWVRLRREDANDTLRISRTIIRHVMETKEAILSADAASDERFEMSQSIADFRIRSMMCAPAAR